MLLQLDLEQNKFSSIDIYLLIVEAVASVAVIVFLILDKVTQ